MAEGLPPWRLHHWKNSKDSPGYRVSCDAADPDKDETVVTIWCRKGTQTWDYQTRFKMPDDQFKLQDFLASLEGARQYGAMEAKREIREALGL